MRQKKQCNWEKNYIPIPQKEEKKRQPRSHRETDIYTDIHVHMREQANHVKCTCNFFLICWLVKQVNACEIYKRLNLISSAEIKI